ncbi:putative ATP-dependent RNA helicase DDX4-like protein [Dinothrombium tinctorium]|uniref:RNA helicase n=1 Tax=Dinothrombium tinctorium TaxID=1965070 RepID=A0A3S3Q9F6_9ACAR|nr:putative ATP-dependent RNA helicase DDX4-like protein [Dinothrombium tinctorium]
MADDDWDSGPVSTITEKVNNTAISSNSANDDWVDDWGSDPPKPETSAAPPSSTGADDWDAVDSGSAPSWNGFGNDSGPKKPIGRGRGGGACFKCNETGHMSRDCPNSGGVGGRGRGGPMRCFNCQQEGHRSSDCPEPKKFGGRTCNNCKQEGHMSRDCPEPRKTTCRNCNQEGHMSRECPQGSSNERKCYNCQQPGHNSRDCPEERKPREPRGGNRNNYNSKNSANNDSGDFDWGTSGGGTTDTTDNSANNENGGDWDWGTTNSTSNEKSGDRGERKGGSGGSNTCRKCNKEGHFAKDCTEEPVGPDGKPRAPIYRNEDLKEDDESLYDTITSGINFDRYDKIPVNVSGITIEPLGSFTGAINSDLLLDAIKKCNYNKPTPVQKYGIPIILAKRDLMACAQTGSGKTAAFLLPIIQDMFKNSNDLPNLYGQPEQTPVCVIVTPTRELALQIYGEAFKFTRGSIIKPQIIYGGTSVQHQIAQMSRGAHILVATPGRLLDFVGKGKVNFNCLKYLILDEADRMIDQGFIPEVRRMVADSSMPGKGKRQTLMFSATFPDEVQRLAAEFLSDDYVFLTVGIVGSANTDVEQEILKVEKYEKRTKLQEILGDSEIKDRTMVFVEQKKTADFLASYLSQSGYKATSIHGDRFQRQREEALYDFKSGRMPILVATSVASRGLDIKDVRHVINYDMPKEIDDYVHRIGRTGRVGNIGKSTSFYDPSTDKELARSLCKILSDAQQKVPDWLNDESGESSFAGNSGRSNFGGTDIRRVNINKCL